MANRKICTTTFKLNNGQQIPAVGLGTWQGGLGSEDEDALESSIIHALRSGYRLIDTAQYYGVESVVGRAIRNSGTHRSEITVITKFWDDWHHDPETALQKSLKDLDIGYIDIFLMHWPCATSPAPESRSLLIDESPTFVETWKKMESLVSDKCRAIGVSNFTQKTLEVLLRDATVVPAVNQVELHAFNPNHRLVPYCESKGIQVISWSTMGGERPGAVNEILTHELFQTIADKHSCSCGVVSLSWAVQRNIVVIPKSSSKARIAENIKLVTLDDEDMDRINSAHKTIRRDRIADRLEALMVEVGGVKRIKGWSAVDFGWEDEEGNWLT